MEPSSQPQFKRTRQSHGKVRTGCLTCKTRRVKCDETKPACKRCIKWGGECDGYAVNNSKPITVGRRPLISPVPILPATTKPLCRSPHKSPFANDLEYHSFQRFAQQTARHLTGFRDSQIWSRVVLQASEDNAFIRHAVTAIGALNLQNWAKKDNEQSRLEFAYQEYEKAIVGLRKATSDRTADVRIKLIACILFACFEAYHGNNESATAQVYSGIELMELYKRKRLQAPPTATEYVLRPKPTAKPQTLDPEIIETLMLFEIQFSSYVDARKSSKHRERMKRFGHAAEFMPAEFTSLAQASAMLTRILLWGIHVRFIQDGTDTVDDFALPPSPTITTTIEGRLPPLLGLRSCTNVYAELAKALSKYTKWQNAFAPLWTTAKRSPGTPLFHGAALLQIHCLASYIWLASGSPSRSMYYRKHTRLLREIVTLAKLLNAQEESGSFSLDFRTVLPLMIVSSNYRHIAMRKEVIAIFEEKPRREGLWDSRLLSRIARWVAGIEEEGVGEEEEYVPEERIVEIVKIRQDSEGREAFVRCRQGEGDQGVFFETTLSW